MNYYKYLYYALYKVTKLSKKARLHNQVADFTLSTLFIGMIFYLVAFLLTTNLISYIPIDYLKIALILLSIAIYYFSKRLFLRNQKDIEIENYFDKTNKLKKGHFIAIYITYIILSITFMLVAGIYYNS